MSRPEFSLRVRVREVIESSSQADPKQVTAEVLATITKAELAQALAQALPDFVRIIVGEQRQRVLPSSGPAKSWKTEAAKNYADKLLRQRIDISGTGVDWKFLGDCDDSDLLSLAAIRRGQAAELEATAVWYERIAGLLAESGAETVAELPAAALTELATHTPAALKAAA